MASLIPILVAGLVSILFGIRYLLTQQFMGYHAVVAGKSWPEIERGTQVAILGMLRVCGAGFLAYGLALLWFLVPLSRGEAWAAWAALTATTALVAPILHVTLGLRRFAPGAKTPVVPTIVVFLLVLAGSAASYFRI